MDDMENVSKTQVITEIIESLTETTDDNKQNQEISWSTDTLNGGRTSLLPQQVINNQVVIQQPQLNKNNIFDIIDEETYNSDYEECCRSCSNDESCLECLKIIFCCCLFDED